MLLYKLLIMDVVRLWSTGGMREYEILRGLKLFSCAQSPKTRCSATLVS
jgi:hypothetical protein